MNVNLNGEWIHIGDILINSENPQEKDTTKIISGIYGLRNRINGKWYIGQSINIAYRLRNGYSKMKCKNQRKIFSALLKYGYDTFDKIIIEECSVDWIMNYREMYWIKYFNSVYGGYNLQFGGNSRKPSDETRKRISDSLKGFGKGIKKSEEVRKKLSAAKMGVTPSIETRRKQSESARNKPKMTTETKRKMSLYRINMTQSHRDNLRESSKNAWNKSKSKRREESEWGIYPCGKNYHVSFYENGNKIYKSGFSTIISAQEWRDLQVL